MLQDQLALIEDAVLLDTDTMAMWNWLTRVDPNPRSYPLWPEGTSFGLVLALEWVETERDDPSYCFIIPLSREAVDALFELSGGKLWFLVPRTQIIELDKELTPTSFK